jgi:hypothetical protein
MTLFYTFPVQHWTFVLDGFSGDAQLTFDDNITLMLKDQKKMFVYNQQGHLLQYSENVSSWPAVPTSPLVLTPTGVLIADQKINVRDPIAAAINTKGVLAVFSGGCEINLFNIPVMFVSTVAEIRRATSK